MVSIFHTLLQEDSYHEICSEASRFHFSHLRKETVPKEWIIIVLVFLGLFFNDILPTQLIEKLTLVNSSMIADCVIITLNVLGLNTGKHGPEITPHLDTFHAVSVFVILKCRSCKRLFCKYNFVNNGPARNTNFLVLSAKLVHKRCCC